MRRWNTEVNKLLADRAFTEKYFASAAMTPTGGTPADLAAIAKASRQVGAELVTIAKLKFE